MSLVPGRIYLDAMASGPLDARVARVLAEALGATGNPASVHQHGQRARALVDAASAQVAALLGADSGDVIFTSGGTEANNTAIKGVALPHVGTAARVVTTAIEHPSVLETCRYLRALGLEVLEVPPDRTGRIDPQRVEQALSPATVLVSVMWANNETGTVQPIEEIAALCRTAGVPFHTDATQAVGKLPVGVEGVDLLTLSGHKLYAPQGIGALYVRRGITLSPLHHGGGQQEGRRGGTVPAALCAALGEAARLAREEREERAAALKRLARRFIQRVRQSLEDVACNGSQEYRLPGAVNLSAEGVRGDLLVLALDLAGVSVSHGSACASGAMEMSHVLRAMGLPEARVRAAIRVSPTPWTAEEEIDRAAELYIEAVSRQREGRTEHAHAHHRGTV